MRIGQKRRDLQDIFNAASRSTYAQLTLVNKAAREEIRKKVHEVEESLGLEGIPLEGDVRNDLMLMIGILNHQIEGLEEEIAKAKDELNQMSEAMKILEERSAIQDELIKVYKALVGSQDVVSAKLEEQIQELNDRLEQLNSASKSKRSKELSPEDQRKQLEEKIKRSEKRRAKLVAELEAILAGDISGSAGCGSDSLSDAEDTVNAAEDTQDQMNAEPVREQEVENPGQEPEASAEEPDQVQEAEEAAQEQEMDSGESCAESVPGESAEDPGEVDHEADVNYWKERAQELEAQLEEKTYQANMDSTNSSVPPRMRGYSDAQEYRCNGTEPVQAGNEPASESSAGTGAGQSSGDGSAPEEEDPIAAMEAAAEEAALHDPSKSPDTKRTGRRGKRKGSPGGGRKWPNADEYREKKCYPSQCEACPHKETCEGFRNAEKFDRPNAVFDIEIKRVMTYHQPMRCQCPRNGGETLTGTYPDEAKNWLCFGTGIRSLAVVLNTVGMVSYARTADILRGLIGDEQLCAGTVVNWVREAADKLHPTVRYIKAGVFSGEYLHSDESGLHVKGALHWVHTACNMMFTYLRVDRQRGEGAMKRIGVLTAYMGTLITDCWQSYWGLGSRHGLCIAHLLRELFALVKYFSRDKEWAQRMMDLLYDMRDKREKLKAENKTEFAKEDLESFYKKYDDIIADGLKVHPDSEAKKGKRGKAKHYRGRNLLDRLQKHKKEFLLFLVDFECPFSNNIAERSLRLFSTKRAVVGSFDTYEGADDFAVIWSYIATARKRDLNSYDAIHAALEGESTSFLFCEEELRELDEVLEDLDQKNLEQFHKDREDEKTLLEEARKKAAEKHAQADQKAEKARAQASKAAEAMAKAEEARRKADELKSSGMEGADVAEAKAFKAEKRASAMLGKAEKAKQSALSSREKAEKEDKKVRDLEAYIAWSIRAAAYFLEVPEEYWHEMID